MSLEMELHLQQCRIFQNKDKDAVTIPYTNDANFYQTLDRHIFNGYKIKIIFPDKKLAEGSPLWERILSCFNGQRLIIDSPDYYAEMQGIMAFNTQDQFDEALKQHAQTDNRIYNSYIFKCVSQDQNILILEPAGEGLPSYSFTVDI